MRKYLITFAATFAIVAALTIPHHVNSDAAKGIAGSPAVLSRRLGEHRSAEGQKLHITPVQAQVAVVGLAFGRR
jgi:hypothetical protein